MKKHVQNNLIQVGIRATRLPDGKTFGDAEPIYMQKTPELVSNQKNVITAMEKVEAECLRNYIDALKKVANEMKLIRRAKYESKNV